MSWKHIYSYAHLILAFWMRQLQRIYRPGDNGGAARFLENYAPEGMAPLSLEAEEALKRAGGCIHCGLCEATHDDPLVDWIDHSRALAHREHLAARRPSAGSVEGFLCPMGLDPSEIALILPT